MRIALVHNLMTSPTPEEISYTSQIGVDGIAASLRANGHDVLPVEITTNIEEIIRRLVDSGADLVFNLAEGRQGRHRLAMVPMLCEELGIAYTGSGPHAQSTALDKNHTKLMARSLGITTPDWRFVRRSDDLVLDDFEFPAIVKPNFEASSRGIDGGSVVHDPTSTSRQVDAVLQNYPEGVLVEQYIPGREVSVAFLEAVDNDHDGALQVHELALADGEEFFAFDSKVNLTTTFTDDRPPSDWQPAPISPAAADQARRATAALARAMDVRDFARADFRLSREGVPHLLEMNSLPSLLPGASIHGSAAATGLDRRHGVVGAIVASALARATRTQSTAK